MVKNWIKASPLLLLVGFLFSCGVDPNVETARLHLAAMEFEEVIEEAEAAIENNPENPDGYYYKALGLAQKAFNDREPGERVELYDEAREYFNQARELYAEETIPSSEAQELPEMVRDFWGSEHNEGIQKLADEFEETHEDSLELARHHFRNATTINPDSSVTYNLLSEVNFVMGNLEEAVESTERIMEMGEATINNYYRMSFFLEELGRYDEALAILEDAREEWPDEIEVIQQMANIHLGQGNTDEALATLEELIERDPDNPQFRLVYGSQIYQLALEIDEDIQERFDRLYDINQEIQDAAREQPPNEELVEELQQEFEDVQNEIRELEDEMYELSSKAEEELQQVTEMDPDNANAYSTLGIIYQNRAANVFEHRNLETDHERAEELDQEGQELLREALPYYERAAELEPDNEEHWTQLFRIYTNLGMEEEAEHAQEQADLQLQQQQQQQQN